MSYKNVLLGLGLAAVIAAAGVTATVGFAQAEDPPLYPENHAFMSQRSMRWMSAGAEGWMAGELGEVMHEAMIAAFAEALGLDPADLEARLEAGEHLMDIAIAQGLTADEVWEIMQAVRDDARASLLDSGIELPEWRERMLDNPFNYCDEDGAMDEGFPRRGGRAGSFTEGRFFNR